MKQGNEFQLLKEDETGKITGIRLCKNAHLTMYEFMKTRPDASWRVVRLAVFANNVVASFVSGNYVKSLDITEAWRGYVLEYDRDWHGSLEGISHFIDAFFNHFLTPLE